MASSYKKEREKTDSSVVEKNSEKPIPRALTLSLISINAALYAAAITVTSPIPTPWGVGHFRPGVVVPAFFAVVFGPIVGGVGAAIGTFIGDFALFFFGLTTPLLSLVAGVPGNFVGFYLLGWLISKRRSWSSFIISSSVALVVGNLIAALGVLGYFLLFSDIFLLVPDWASSPIRGAITITIGLTVFWVVTMIVFVVPLVPILVAYTTPVLTEIGVRGVSSLTRGRPINIIKSSSVVSIILAGLYISVTFIPEGSIFFLGAVKEEILILLLLSSVVVFAFGLIFAYVVKKLEKTLSQ